MTRVEESDREMTDALEGQRRLVREVHHRVKNNLQVVASLLNIHGRSAGHAEARAAYAAISRRVEALSVVHRNHYAEMEENRGIALRPLLTELAADLRASAPEAARGMRIDLDLDTRRTRPRTSRSRSPSWSPRSSSSRCSAAPEEPIEIVASADERADGAPDAQQQGAGARERTKPGKTQFERIVAGLAQQFRSTARAQARPLQR